MYNEVTFCGYETRENKEKLFALMEINLFDKKEVFWLRVNSALDLILKL